MFYMSTFPDTNREINTYTTHIFYFTVFVYVCRPDFAWVDLETIKIKKKNPPLSTRHDASPPLEGTRDREMCPRFIRGWGAGSPAVKEGPSPFSRGPLHVPGGALTLSLRGGLGLVGSPRPPPPTPPTAGVWGWGRWEAFFCLDHSFTPVGSTRGPAPAQRAGHWEHIREQLRPFLPGGP